MTDNEVNHIVIGERLAAMRDVLRCLYQVHDIMFDVDDPSDSALAASNAFLEALAIVHEMMEEEM